MTITPADALNVVTDVLIGVGGVMTIFAVAKSLHRTRPVKRPPAAVVPEAHPETTCPRFELCRFHPPCPPGATGPNCPFYDSR